MTLQVFSRNSSNGLNLKDGGWGREEGDQIKIESLRKTSLLSYCIEQAGVVTEYTCSVDLFLIVILPDWSVTSVPLNSHIFLTKLY